MAKAIYAGSFDPPTNGHLWVIDKAAKIFDQLIVAVGNNPGKHYTFSLKERVELLQKVLEPYSNIIVGEYAGKFLANYAVAQGADYIVRGIRNAQDYEFEKTLRYINADVAETVNTIFLIPPRDYAEVSSSLVKGFVGTSGWQDVAKKYVPEVILAALLEKDLSDVEG